MSLIKGPFEVRMNDTVINNVSKIVYVDGQLGIDILIEDYDAANLLLENTRINRVYCIGCSYSKIGATYYTTDYRVGIVIEDNAIMVLRVIFGVGRAKIGEITE